MHDPRVVGLGQSFRGLGGELEDASREEGALAQDLAERPSLHQLHRDVPDVVHRPDLVDRHDVRVVEGGGGARLLLEAGEPFRVRAGGAAEHLDRDRASQGEVPRAVDLTHAARAELPLEDLVAAEPSLLDQVDGRGLAH